QTPVTASTGSRAVTSMRVHAYLTQITRGRTGSRTRVIITSQQIHRMTDFTDGIEPIWFTIYRGGRTEVTCVTSALSPLTPPNVMLLAAPMRPCNLVGVYGWTRSHFNGRFPQSWQLSVPGQ
ncbi:hypothetical protein Vafri_5686, partial [Volvox africanus]